jgi:Tfp pilus assembly protein PilV
VDTLRRQRHDRRAFSLVEVVIATAIISFALLGILGVMAASLATHQDAGTDSVLTLMTESSLQEIRNLGFSNINYNYTNSTPVTNYYVYFDSQGQVTADGNSSSVDTETSTATAAPTTNSLPATTALTSSTIPSGTVYQCKITPSTVTLASASSTSGSMYRLKLTFTWPAGAPNPKTNIVNSSISYQNAY